MLSPDNDTAIVAARRLRASMPSATTICRAWEDAKAADPTLQFKTTFKQWRNRWLKAKRKGKKNG